MFSKKRGALKTPGAEYSWKRRSKCFRRKEEPSEGKGLNIRPNHFRRNEGPSKG
jgi:hypothetical protein